MASIPDQSFAVIPKIQSLSLSSKLCIPTQFRRRKISSTTACGALILTQTTKFLCDKTSSGSVIKARSRNISAIWPGGGAAETDNLPSSMRKLAIDAIDSYGRRVTISDMVIETGLKLNDAQKALQAISADTDGFLEVLDGGDILYIFQKDYRSKLVTKSFRIKIEPFLEKASKMTAKCLAFHIPLILCMIWWIIYPPMISGVPLFLHRCETEEDSRLNMNLFQKVFSVVFGDGDPNQGIEEKRWKMIGQRIASNGGIVTAEELSPYLDLKTTEEMCHDSYILPVLQRFDGQPKLDGEGNIFYYFPSLQQRSELKECAGRRNDWVGETETFLKEKKLQLSKFSVYTRQAVLLVLFFNLFWVGSFGYLYRGDILRTYGPTIFATYIIPLTQIFAASIYAISLSRKFIIKIINARIDKRNRVREQYARELESPDSSLRSKLLTARSMAAHQKTFIGKDTTIQQMFFAEIETT